MVRVGRRVAFLEEQVLERKGIPSQIGNIKGQRSIKKNNTRYERIKNMTGRFYDMCKGPVAAKSET